MSSKLYSIKLITLLVFLSACSSGEVAIQEILDGDTVVFKTDRTVRLLQIDTPELDEDECYAQEAKAELIKIFTASEKTRLTSYKGEAATDSFITKKDKISDDKDQFNRELRYVFFNGVNVNLEMVKRGAAAPYFFDGQRGVYSEELLAAAQSAKDNQIGLWGLCPSAILNPDSSLSTGFSGANDSGILVTDGGINCDPNYQGCIPPYPPDLNCDDIRALGLAPVYRIGADPHGLDRDRDGVGCENN
jgi:endonuclease YncB( thermonuclease family)